MVRAISWVMRVAAMLVLVGVALQAQAIYVKNDHPTRDYPEYVVGDPWSVEIVGGGAYKTVETHAIHDSTDLGTQPNGYTDSTGRYYASGNIDSSTIGHWVETVYVDGVPISTDIEFDVSAPETCTFSGGYSIYTIYSADYHDLLHESSYTVPGSPQVREHKVTHGPCTLFYAFHYAYGPYLDAEADDLSSPDEGVEWTISDNFYAATDSIPSVSRCRTDYFSNPCDYSYPVYEDGSAQTIFQHPDTSAYIWVTSYYSLYVSGYFY